MNLEIERELEKLKAQDPEGLLRPKAVVEFAANPKTALHSRFEWDDSKAAHAYRLWQAEHLIVRVALEVGPPQKTQTVQAFVSLPSDRRAGGGYRHILDVYDNDAWRAELLEQARADMLTFRRKYSGLQELAQVIEAMTSAA